jgi:signal transduction histidine kinase
MYAIQKAHTALSLRELEVATDRLLRYAVLEERSRISHDLHDSIGHGFRNRSASGVALYDENGRRSRMLYGMRKLPALMLLSQKMREN